MQVQGCPAVLALIAAPLAALIASGCDQDAAGSSGAALRGVSAALVSDNPARRAEQAKRHTGQETAHQTATASTRSRAGQANANHITQSPPHRAPGPAGESTAPAVETSPVAIEPLGAFALTYYWRAHQPERTKPNKRKVQLYTSKCEPLAKVSAAFARQLTREGTGRLRDGRAINVAGECRCKRSPCYFVLNRKKRWGVGVGYRPLSPFRSVAVDPEAVPIGTILYVPEFDGLTMPGRRPWGGFVHDGCVVADDRGGAVDGHHIDLYMAEKSHYHAFNRRHRLTQVTVYDGRGRCERDGDKVVPVNRNST